MTKSRSEQPALPLVYSGAHVRDLVYGEISAGARAQQAGKPCEANPHPVGMYLWSLWRTGWRYG